MDEFKQKETLWETVEGDKINMDFIRANKQLDIIQKSLSEYLNSKRLVFPRYFFVSEDQLMEILAQTKDPIFVQKHLGKTFEAINSLDFNENMEICGMMSNLGEKVAFKNKIDVNKTDLKGQVEIWIREVEFEMINTL